MGDIWEVPVFSLFLDRGGGGGGFGVVKYLQHIIFNVNCTYFN